MTKEQYLAKRQELLNKAQEAINTSKLEDAMNFKKEVEDLDNKYTEIAQAQANLNALNNNIPTLPDFANNTVEPTNVIQTGNTDFTAMNGSNSYEQAWAKFMMNQPLNSAEKAVMAQHNESFSNATGYTHTTENTSVVIPTTVIDGIVGIIEGMYPMYGDTTKLSIKGNISIPKNNAIIEGDIENPSQDEEAEGDEYRFGTLDLTGHKVSKTVKVQWELRDMSIPAFLKYIENKLGERLASVIGVWVARGNGLTQPQGVVTALKEQAGKTQIVEYAEEPTYKQMKQTMSKVHASYLNGAVVYANNATVWNVLAEIKDGTGKDAFIADATQGGVGRVFGYTVKVDAGLQDGDIVVGNMKSGYTFNTNKDLSVISEEKATKQVTNYVGYGLVDGGVVDETAFALLTKTTTP